VEVALDPSELDLDAATMTARCAYSLSIYEPASCTVEGVTRSYYITVIGQV
jgi:hypothetical protein